jgi:hypothetical protein
METGLNGLSELAEKLREDQIRSHQSLFKQHSYQYPDPQRRAVTEGKLETDHTRLQHLVPGGQAAALAPLLHRIAPSLGVPGFEVGSAVELVQLSAPLGNAAGVGVFWAGPASSDPGAVNVGMIIKIGRKEDIVKEHESLVHAAQMLGDKVPKILRQDAEIFGEQAAIFLEHCGARPAPPPELSVPHSSWRAGTLGDILTRGAGHFAVLDIQKSAPEAMERYFLLEPLDASVVWGPRGAWGFDFVGPNDLQAVASQAAGICSAMTRAPVDVQEVQGFDFLNEIARELDRHILARAFPTPSPLHERCRQQSAARYQEVFGRSIDEVIETATALKNEIHKIESASRGRDGAGLAKPVYPLVQSHGMMRPQHMLLSRSSDGLPVLKVCDWCTMKPGPVLDDPATLLASLALEGMRLPMDVKDLQHLISERLFSAAEFSRQIRIPEAAAVRLFRFLNSEGNDADYASTLALAMMIADAAGLPRDASEVGTEVSAGSPSAQSRQQTFQQLLGLLAAGPTEIKESFSEAGRITEALLDWEGPKIEAASNKGKKSVPPPPKARVARGGATAAHAGRFGDAGSRRALQWSWRASREFRTAMTEAVPALREGNAGDGLWRMLWWLPQLRLSLGLLDAPHLPWPQKLWALHHAQASMERVLAWLKANAHQGGLAFTLECV